MAKVKTQYSCNKCGTTFPRWQGKCDSCNEWNTIVEDIGAANASPLLPKKNTAKAAPITYLHSEHKPVPRIETGMSEFDRVLGGGFVPGSAILIGGDPGIGKSTLLLQTAAYFTKKNKVLYVCGEESTSQVQMRAKRLGVDKAEVELCPISQLEMVLATIKHNQPDIVIIDSIQTLFAESADSAPGSVSQLRLCAHALIQVAKASGIGLIFVGHVTKDGTIAGPRVIEHMVDGVLYFEGDRGHSFRLLRAFKNRFGATNEIGVFDMRDTGLTEVTNPSALFLEGRPEGASGSVVLPALNGTRPLLVEVQALVSKSQLSQPRRTTLGLDANRVSMVAAVLDKHAGTPFGEHDVFVNIVGGLKINEPAADLAIATALMSSFTNTALPHDMAVFGELGLSGEIRNVTSAGDRATEATKLGYGSLLCPPSDGIKGTTEPIKHIGDLLGILRG